MIFVSLKLRQETIRGVIISTKFGINELSTRHTVRANVLYKQTQKLQQFNFKRIIKLSNLNVKCLWFMSHMAKVTFMCIYNIPVCIIPVSWVRVRAVLV